MREKPYQTYLFLRCLFLHLATLWCSISPTFNPRKDSIKLDETKEFIVVKKEIYHVYHSILSDFFPSLPHYTKASSSLSGQAGQVLKSGTFTKSLGWVSMSTKHPDSDLLSLDSIWENHLQLKFVFLKNSVLAAEVEKHKGSSTSLPGDFWQEIGRACVFNISNHFK